MYEYETLICKLQYYMCSNKSCLVVFLHRAKNEITGMVIGGMSCGIGLAQQKEASTIWAR